MRLWTLQRAAFLERARRDGIAWATWDGVQPPRWREAFRWMLEHTPPMAGVVPARRAAAVDPMIALRQD